MVGLGVFALLDRRRLKMTDLIKKDDVVKEDDVVARNEKVVRRFIDAWGALDVEAAMACLAANIVYVNQPLEPVVGLAGVRKIIQGILDRTRKVEWKLLNVFGRGNTICTERLDCWDFDGKGWGLQLPCIGMFDLDSNGQICGWRDYFDNQLWFKHGGPTLHV
jgi:limonene-1,2-epoxide hydrolase